MIFLKTHGVSRSRKVVKVAGATQPKGAANRMRAAEGKSRRY
jgi:hypothetical protein